MRALWVNGVERHCEGVCGNILCRSHTNRWVASPMTFINYKEMSFAIKSSSEMARTTLSELDVNVSKSLYEMFRATLRELPNVANS